MDLIDQLETDIKKEIPIVKEKISGLIKHFDILHIILVFIVAISITSIGWNIFKPTNPVTPTQFIQPPGIKEVEKIKTITVPGPQIIYIYPKDEVDKQMPLPPAFKNNTSAKIISSADLQPSKAGYRVLGTLTTKDGIGKGGILAEEKERSVLSFPSNISIGTRYGYITSGKQEAQIYGKYQPLRLGNFYLGVYGEANSKPEGKAMLDLEYKYKSD